MPLVQVPRDLSSGEKEHKPTVGLLNHEAAAEKSGDFNKAKGLLEQALKDDPQNPDILVMLAHTQLKRGMIDESL